MKTPHQCGQILITVIRSKRNSMMNRKKIFLFIHFLSAAWSSQVGSRVYNKIYSVNLQGVLVSLEVNRIVDLQRDKDSLEVGYSYQYSPGWKQGLQRRLFCRPPRWINLTLKLNVDLPGVLVSESSWTSSRLIATEEQSMVSYNWLPKYKCKYKFRYKKHSLVIC